MPRLFASFLLVFFNMIVARAEGGFGAGAFPLSRTVVSMWVKGDSESGKQEPIALVYFTGPEDWHQRKWQSKLDGSTQENERITHQLISSSITLEIAISPDRRSVFVQGCEFILHDANVFVVKNAHEPKNQSIESLGRLALPEISEEPLSVAVLRANPNLKSKLE